MTDGIPSDDEDLPAQTTKLTGIGVVKRLRNEYGIQATTCVGPNPGNPNDVTAAVAVQQLVHRGEDYLKFLKAQGFECVESLGRGLSAWERTGEVYYGDNEDDDREVEEGSE